MGLLDSALNMLGDGKSQQPDARTRLIQATLSFLTDSSHGGLQGLMQRFEQAGLGNAITSWIADEPNVPITPGQVEQAMGDGPLQRIAGEAGIEQNHAAALLSELLPTLVDKLTPAGHIPQGGLGNMSTLLEHFIKF